MLRTVLVEVENEAGVARRRAVRRRAWLRRRAKALRARYEGERAKADKAAAVAQAAADAKQKLLDEAALEEQRKAYAKTLARNLLDQDTDADVDAIGPGHTTLRLTYVLATKLFVYKFTQSEQAQEEFQDVRALGFKKFVIRDGYDRSWTWNL